MCEHMCCVHVCTHMCRHMCGSALQKHIMHKTHGLKPKDTFIYLYVCMMFISEYTCSWTSPVAQRVKHLPAVQETRVQSLGQEDLVEKEMATHSSTLAWKIPWTEEPARLQSMGSRRVGHE